MANLSLTQLFFQFLNPRKLMFWMILFGILCILSAIYGYYQFYLPMANAKRFNDLSNKKVVGGGEGGGSDVTIYFFHVDWCPHCKTAAPEWQAFLDNYNNKEVNGYILRCISQDCTNDTDQNVQSMISQYNIVGYPTIKMVKDGQTIDLDATVNKYNLEQFVINMVGPFQNNNEDN